MSAENNGMINYPPGFYQEYWRNDNAPAFQSRTTDVMEHPKTIVRNKISTSYGLIVFSYQRSGAITFLMTKRRDTFSYECILRGIYRQEQLEEYMTNTTEEERSRFLIHDFDTLWKDLWVSTKRRLYRMEYKKASELYQRNSEIIKELTRTLPTYGKDVWEFPKGKMFSEENMYQCALREFEEETHIKKTNVTIIKPAGSYEDNYEGTDHNMYRSIYFVGYIPRGYEIPIHYQPCPHNVRGRYISDEVMDMKWMTLQETLALCSESKRSIIERVVQYLEYKE